MGEGLRVLHYLNQLFGGIGGEDKADVAPEILEGPVGPGKALEVSLKGRGKVIATAICGDNYFSENTDKAVEELLRLLTPCRPDVVIAGPAFNAGRYGIACGEICKAIHEKLSIPAVTAMNEENPGVDLYKKDVYILRVSDSAVGMTKAVEAMVNLLCKLAAKEKIGRPSEDGYFPRGFLRTEESGETAAKRSVDMLISKLKGEPFESELILPKFEKVKPAPGLKDITKAKIGLVTDGGLTPKGNPDKLEARCASKFGSYNIKGRETLDSKEYQANHLGYDTSFANEDPTRVIPLDVLRDMEKKGVIGRIHDTFYTLAGVGTPMANSKRIGREIAGKLKEGGVEGVILTST